MRRHPSIGACVQLYLFHSRSFVAAALYEKEKKNGTVRFFCNSRDDNREASSAVATFEYSTQLMHLRRPSRKTCIFSQNSLRHPICSGTHAHSWECFR